MGPFATILAVKNRVPSGLKFCRNSAAHAAQPAKLHAASQSSFDQVGWEYRIWNYGPKPGLVNASSAEYRIPAELVEAISGPKAATFSVKQEKLVILRSSVKDYFWYIHHLRYMNHELVTQTSIRFISGGSYGPKEHGRLSILPCDVMHIQWQDFGYSEGACLVRMKAT